MHINLNKKKFNAEQLVYIEEDIEIKFKRDYEGFINASIQYKDKNINFNNREEIYFIYEALRDYFKVQEGGEKK
jgi:hypothetical protein